jgi:hypothetical protein
VDRRKVSTILMIFLHMYIVECNLNSVALSVPPFNIRCIGHNKNLGEASVLLEYCDTSVGDWCPCKNLET